MYIHLSSFSFSSYPLYKGHICIYKFIFDSKNEAEIERQIMFISNTVEGQASCATSVTCFLMMNKIMIVDSLLINIVSIVEILPIQ